LGGALSLDNIADIVLEDIEFIENKAISFSSEGEEKQAKGGAIHFSCEGGYSYELIS
jgi:hypothetical protein